MSDLKDQKEFFKLINNAISQKAIETAFCNLFHKDVRLNVFDEILDKHASFTEYQLKFSNGLNDIDKLLAGEPVFTTELTIQPILLGEQFIGTIEIKDFNREELDILDIASSVVALKISNLRLNQALTKSSNFNNAMRNIAKIIETQYELNYIIPLIGEILDMLIENRLIYIFLKQRGKMKLVWPSKCLDSKILKNIQNTDKDVILSDDKKIVYVPMISENNILGCIVAKSTDDEITSQEIYHLGQLVSQSAITVSRANVYAQILKNATLDALTGFYNRRQLDERVKQEVSQAKRKNSPLCAIMADIDFFKSVNDTYGHAAGDLVLKTVAKIMRSQLREYDIAARYGGEEFMILLPYTDSEDAVHVAERLRKAVSIKNIDISKVNTKNNVNYINVTISIGICKYENNISAEQFIINADKALYKAKETGRNKTIFYKK